MPVQPARQGGRPTAAKCAKCKKKYRPCGPGCDDWPGRPFSPHDAADATPVRAAAAASSAVEPGGSTEEPTASSSSTQTRRVSARPKKAREVEELHVALREQATSKRTGKRRKQVDFGGKAGEVRPRASCAAAVGARASRVPTAREAKTGQMTQDGRCSAVEAQVQLIAVCCVSTCCLISGSYTLEKHLYLRGALDEHQVKTVPAAAWLLRGLRARPSVPPRSRDCRTRKGRTRKGSGVPAEPCCKS